MYFSHIIFGPELPLIKIAYSSITTKKTFTTTILSPKPPLNKSTSYHNHHHHHHHSVQPPLPIFTLQNNHLHDNHHFKSTICTTKTNLTHLFLFYHIPDPPPTPASPLPTLHTTCQPYIWCPQQSLLLQYGEYPHLIIWEDLVNHSHNYFGTILYYTLGPPHCRI